MKIYIYVAIGLAIVGGLFWFIQEQRAIGERAEREKQEQANAKFREELQKGASSFDACDRSGGLWDFRKGTCQFP